MSALGSTHNTGLATYPYGVAGFGATPQRILGAIHPIPRIIKPKPVIHPPRLTKVYEAFLTSLI